MERKSNGLSRIRSTMAIGAAIGTGIGLLLFAYSVVAALGICSNLSPAETLFPYSMMIGPSLDAGLPMLIIALIQYPLYGAMLGLFCGLTGRHRYLVIPMMLLIAGNHYMAVIEARP
jgi:hypothetical protein